MSYKKRNTAESVDDNKSDAGSQDNGNAPAKKKKIIVVRKRKTKTVLGLKNNDGDAVNEE